MQCVRRLSTTFGGVLLVFSLTACGGNKTPETAKPSAPSESPECTENCAKPVVSEKARDDFQDALDAFVHEDKDGSWTLDSCTKVAGLFAAALEQQKRDKGAPIPEAHYNAGLAYQRCTMDEQAKQSFSAAVKLDGKFHKAQAQLALYEFKEHGNVDEAIAKLDQIIRDAQFQNVGGLVALASLQMMRNSGATGTNCNDDLSCAHLNLQRALAIDDAFMPAFNQLALYYLQQARGDGPTRQTGLVVASAKKSNLNKQRLDLASLVASQALQKNPKYAPIHNTIGLIQVELHNYNSAVKSFGQARSINPKLFEAQMNYAAVNLSFRGFGEAEAAYRTALQLRPDTYEAHLGLALALRGQINDRNYDKKVAESQKHLEEAKKLEPKRPEAYYNEAILTEEYRAKRAGVGKEQLEMWKDQIRVFQQAASQYQAFIERAGDASHFRDAVEVSKGRIQDIQDTLNFIEESVELAKNPPASAPLDTASEDAEGS